MLKIDRDWLISLGLSEDVPVVEVKRLMRFAYETLEVRIGMRLADQMTNQQLDEFEANFEARDDAGWLEANFPNYKEIVTDTYGELGAELREAMPQIEAEIRAKTPVA